MKSTLPLRSWVPTFLAAITDGTHFAVPGRIVVGDEAVAVLRDDLFFAFLTSSHGPAPHRPRCCRRFMERQMERVKKRRAGARRAPPQWRSPEECAPGSRSRQAAATRRSGD